MRKLPKAYLTAFLIATILGACLHFLYTLLPNVITAVFSPVTESVWEHGKLVFWPFLIASAVLTRRSGGRWAPHLLALLLMSVLLLLVGWVYHILFCMDDLRFDVALYVVVMALGFLLAGIVPKENRVNRVNRLDRWTGVLAFLTLALGIAYVLFTFLPPCCCLFADNAGAATWASIPF